MIRIVAAVLAVLMTANGLVMMFAPLAWYAAVPGVATTGPFNAHFVRDIGAVYLVTAGALAWFAWRPAQGWPAVAAVAAWHSLHGAVHVFDAVCGTRPVADLARDFVGVFVPGLVALALIAARRPALSEAAA